MKKSDFNLKSKCCNASVKTESGLPDFIGDKNPRIATMWYVCTKCNQPCDTEEPGSYKPLPSNLNRSYPSQLSLEELIIAPTHVTPSWSVTITKVDNGFLGEFIEELLGDDDNHVQYRRVQTVFESGEYEGDDLEVFKNMVYFLVDHFGITSGTDRRLNMEIYDPNEKPKKGKK